LRADATAPAQGRSLPEIVAKLNDAIARAMATPSAQKSLKKLGVEPKSSTPEAFAETIRTDLDKWPKATSRSTNGPSRYSALTLRSSITLRHEGISAAIMACSSAGVLALASTP
jgi:hypothetical protein